MANKFKHPKVIEMKLGKNRADGILNYDENTIYIDERLRGERKLNTYIHEYFHHLYPKWSEKQVLDAADRMAEFLYIHHVRFTDNI